ncbi:MAG TPA: MFS transporter [Planctomycetota bacterium]|nr:MFS transporter [Planctomycetota bacterium]
MLFLATFVNYLDRSTLASASSFIKKEFSLTEEQYGTLETWFGLPYAVFLVLAGFMADRWSIRWLYAGALLVWSVAGFATGLVSTLFQLQLCRAVLGAGEAYNWPCAVGVVKRVLPRESQGLGNGIFNSGMALGAILTPLLVRRMVDESGHGWRTLFMVVGAAGSLWILLWLSGTRDERARHLARPPEEDRVQPSIPFWRVLGLRRFWITFAIGMAVNVAWHFYRVWLPRHLDVDLHFDPHTRMQDVLMVFYTLADLGSIATGFAARRFARISPSIERSRKVVLLGAALVCLMATPVVFHPPRAVMVPLYCIVGAGIMGVFAMFYAHIQDIAPGHTSKCLGLIGASTWVVNSTLHPLVGRFADTHSPAMGKFAPMILVAGFLPLVAALITFSWPEPSPGTSSS